MRSGIGVGNARLPRGLLDMTSYLLGAYAIRPHPLAPLYASPSMALSTFQQVINEIKSPNFNPNKEAFELIRQTSLVSLWFFLRYVCSYNGPYDRLDDALSIDMCNVRQGDTWERAGAKAAAFFPRGFYKSTVFTTGGNTWDLLRDPNERILIVNAGQDKADSFVSIIQSNFSPSSLTNFFFPSHCAFSSKKGQATTGILIMPNRTKNAQEPSVMSRGVGGGAEGGHFTRINLDDLIGLDDLNQARSASAAMETAKRWVGTNLYALRDGEVSKIGAVTTRFAIDDCYQFMCDSCKTIYGWTKGDIQATQNGEWDIYWRRVEEDGVYLRPDVMSKESLEALVVSDNWSAMTQYYNEPYKTGLAEFVECIIGECKLINTKDKWAILRLGDNFNPQDAVLLGDCDVVMSIDPAATDTGISAKSCRTSIGVWATDSDDYKYRIWSRVGFFSIHQIIDYIFEGNRVFKGYIRATMIEDNAFQKVIKPLVDREVVNRNVYVHAIGVQARGDKKARIRVALGTYLAKGKIWVTREAGKEFREEVKMFPMSDTRLDVLDESEKGIVFSKRPESASQRLEREIEEEEREAEPVGAFGYN
jgi:hypothetical protein